MSSQNLRIVQLIDSLEAGGAERMAVNYANVLVDKIAFSGLIATRKEGGLKSALNLEVNYLFANKQNGLDFIAFRKVYAYCRKNKINYIHAHSSSFFWAVLVKLFRPNVKIIWHDHFGDRVKQVSPNRLLKIFSFFFFLIISVNEELKRWSEKKLLTKKVMFLPNFSLQNDGHFENKTVLNGKSGKRIVFLANLKHPKNHLSFINSFYASEIYKQGWTLHLVGKIFNDQYSDDIISFIQEKNLQKSVFLLDSKNDIQNILNQSTVGVLNSTYEGFPVTLLEYGLAGLTVFSTNVGYCSVLIDDKINGFLFNPSDKILQVELLKKLVNEEEYSTLKKNGIKFKQKIEKEFNITVILERYFTFLNN